MLRLGWKDLERNILLNTLVFILLMVVFATIISGMSIVSNRMKIYRQLKPYLKHQGVFLWADGLTYGEENYLYKDAEELRQYLTGARDVLSVTRWLATTYKGEDIHVWEYSQEVVEMLSPDMEQGRYFSKEDIYSNTLKGVVSHNTSGIRVGDVIRIDNDMVENCYQEIEIIGVMEDGSTLYQPTYYGEDTEDYRQCFQTYDYEVEGGVPVILVAGQQIIANQSKGLFSKVNHRLSDLGFMRQITGPVLISYGEQATKEQVAGDMAVFAGSATTLLRQFTLQEFDENCRNYVFEEIADLLPILFCALVFIAVAAVSAGAISVKKNMHNYAIYYICGLRWKTCAKISLYSSVLITVGAFLFVNGAVAILQILGKLEGTLLSFGFLQFAVCVGTGAGFIIVSWILPMCLVRKTSAVQVLRKR